MVNNGPVVACARGIAALGLLAGCVLTAAPASHLLEWNELMLDAIRADSSAPTLASRSLAILNLASYDAVQSVVRTHQPYRYLLESPAGVSTEAAVITAGYEVLFHLFPTFRARTEMLHAAQLERLPESDAVIAGRTLGRDVAFRLLDARSADGANTEVPYIPSADPGQWRRTSPFFRPPLTPHWRYVQPFSAPSVDPFVPPPPPPLDSLEYAQALNEVQRLGSRESPERTPEQSDIARFWSDFSYTLTPPGHWIEIALDLARDHALPLAEAARLLAWLSLAQADSAIVCWEAKYRYNLWRPVTAIQRADEDQNPLTDPDPPWETFLVSPPFPAYTSGHSTFSKAAAQVLTSFFGTDAVSFHARSDTLPGVVRVYNSFSACADEIGMSRIYGGIHFRFDNREGQRSGRLIADYVTGHFLLPNHQLPLVRAEGAVDHRPRLRIHGQPGHSVLLESSEDLVNWQPVATLTATVGGSLITDPAPPPARQRFYRVRPNARGQ
jgi:hypothetical protein